MILRIDTSSSIPVYAQIVDQIKRAVASGALRSGDALSSLRETAVKLCVNPLTVGKAYKQLEQEGLIETKHGIGSYITADAQGPAENYRHEALAQGIDNLLVDALHMGATFDELKQLVDERIQAANNSFAKQSGDGDNKNDK